MPPGTNHILGLTCTNTMNITLSHPDFKTQLLELRVSGVFSVPRLWLNGLPVKGSKGLFSETCSVCNDAGYETAIVVNSHLFYRLPQVLIDQDDVRLAGKAGWTQYKGWKKSVPMVWLTALLKGVGSMTQFRKLNKSG